jgi:hypothetical protein
LLKTKGIAEYHYQLLENCVYIKMKMVIFISKAMHKFQRNQNGKFKFTYIKVTKNTMSVGWTLNGCLHPLSKPNAFG